MKVQYARAHAMIADVIEASLELGWKGKAGKLFPTSMRHRLLKLSICRLIRWCSRIGGGECGVPSHKRVPEVTTMNRRPLEMRSDNAAQGGTRRVQHGHLLGRFTKLRPGFNPIVRHHLSYHIIYQIYPEMTSADCKIISPNTSFLLNCIPVSYFQKVRGIEDRPFC
jgi:hypothetical protein